MFFYLYLFSFPNSYLLILYSNNLPSWDSTWNEKDLLLQHNQAESNKDQQMDLRVGLLWAFPHSTVRDTSFPMGQTRRDHYICLILSDTSWYHQHWFYCYSLGKELYARDYKPAKSYDHCILCPYSNFSYLPLLEHLNREQQKYTKKKSELNSNATPTPTRCWKSKQQLPSLINAVSRLKKGRGRR